MAALVMVAVTPTVGPAAAQSPAVIISEFLASNGASITDADGDTSDWIELHNTGPAAVDLTGWRLVDGGSSWVLPSHTVAGGGYLIVWASGKDRVGAELHTDFKLKASGEYLGLFDPSGQAASEFADYPEQTRDRAFGVGSNGVTGYLTPTPGQGNGAATRGRAAPPTPAHGRGVYTNPIQEVLSTTTAGATIRYTTDGTEPTEASPAYTGPIPLASTATGITTIRAKTFAAGLDPSAESTWSYVFPAGRFPDKPEAQPGFSIRPVISIHTDSGESPDHLERHEARIEMIDPHTERDGFAISAGIKRVGDTSISRISKPSWRVYFEPEYGAPTLEYPLFDGYGQEWIDPVTEFYRFDLHGGSFDAFQLSHFRLSDRFYKDAQLDMGGLAPHGRYVTVFLNGTFAGAYNLRERADHHFFAQYGTGDPEDYEAGKGHINRAYGRPPRFQDLENGTGAIAEEVMNSPSYSAVAHLVGDPTQLAILMATEVRARVNQCEMRVGVPLDRSTGNTDPFIFLRNDSDQELGKPSSTDGLAGCIYNEVGQSWIDEPEFAEAVEDALAYGFCPGGPLTAPKMHERLDEWEAELGAIFAAESDLWGGRLWAGALETARSRWSEAGDVEILAGLAEAGHLVSCDRRPVVEAPANMVVLANRPTELAIEASDPDGQTLSFAADGLPPGLTLDSTGVISGTPTTEGTWTSQITVTDGSGDWTQVRIEWTVLPNQSQAAPVVVLNEFNAVSTGAGGWAGQDPAFAGDGGNGGDWLELVTTADADLSGYTIELWDRDRRSEVLRKTAAFEFSDVAVWGQVAAGTVITIAEDRAEDPSYEPGAGDWNIGVRANGAGGATLLTTGSQHGFGTNRHEMRVLVRDRSGRAVSPFMGETESWRSAVGGNVGADEVMALCGEPDTADLVVDYREQAQGSSFGQPNACIVDGEIVEQFLAEFRTLVAGDVDCDGSLADPDVVRQLEVLAGVAATGCTNRAAADVDDDGTITLADARRLARCLAGNGPCPE